jgi:N-acetylglucosaminyl-diphospho-decaprenol L-rhamnosyltransferase
MLSCPDSTGKLSIFSRRFESLFLPIPRRFCWTKIGKALIYGSLRSCGKSFMRLLVVIVSYRVTDLTIDCLRSLKEEVEQTPGVKVAVCENGTGGAAADRLRQAIADNDWESWIDLTVIYPNRGFTGGNNAVIRPALESRDPPEYILLLNADTLARKRSLESLVAFMDSHPKVGIAGSMLLWPDGTIRSSCFRFLGIASEFDRGLRVGLVSKLLSPWQTVFPMPKEASRVGWVPGASMILRRTMLEEIGLLDEGLYTYFDDPDICLRAHRAGWETWYVPESQVVHLEGSSTEIASHIRKPARLAPYWYQARRRYFLKNYGAIYAAVADAAFIIGYGTWLVRRWIQGKSDNDAPHLWLDSVRHSVFFTGPKVKAVENPALREASVQ